MTIKVGDKVKGVITNITNFGAFVELEDKKTGLIHISEIADHYVKDIHDELEAHQEVEVKVLKIEDNGNIALSLKQADPNQTHSQAGHSENREHSHDGGHHNHKSSNKSYGHKPHQARHKKPEDFDDLMNDFLKTSEDRLSSLRSNVEGKRGGRGGRRG